MAVLTTARGAQDDATRKQVHVIQDHLRKLSGDFGRFSSAWTASHPHPPGQR